MDGWMDGWMHKLACVPSQCVLPTYLPTYLLRHAAPRVWVGDEFPLLQLLLVALALVEHLLDEVVPVLKASLALVLDLQPVFLLEMER